MPKRGWTGLVVLVALAAPARAEEDPSWTAWTVLEARLDAGEASPDEVVSFVATWAAWANEGVSGHAGPLRALEAARARLDGLGVHSQRVRPSSSAGSGALSDRIAALGGGGSSAWDDAVRALLVEAADIDGSGLIDAPTELDRIGCEAWTAIDEGVRHTWDAGLYVTYGFGVNLLWIGDAIGLPASQREAGAERLRACGVPGATDEPAAGIDAARMTEALGRLPEVGQAAWHEVVRAMVLGLYDLNGSGDLDTSEEARSVPCAVWTGLDAALAQHTGAGLVATHRLDDPSGIVGHRLGFERTLGVLALELVRACGVGNSVAPAQPPPSSLLAWDADRSGQLDRRAEIEAVPCEVWNRVDIDLRAELGLGVWEVWGLSRRIRWSDGTADAPTLKGATRAALRRCDVPQGR